MPASGLFKKRPRAKGSNVSRQTDRAWWSYRNSWSSQTWQTVPSWPHFPQTLCNPAGGTSSNWNGTRVKGDRQIPAVDPGLGERTLLRTTSRARKPEIAPVRADQSVSAHGCQVGGSDVGGRVPIGVQERNPLAQSIIEGCRCCREIPPGVFLLAQVCCRGRHATAIGYPSCHF